MREDIHSVKLATLTRGISIGLLALAPLLVLSLFAAGGRRVRLLPKFTAGEVLRYQIETRSTTAGTTTSPIANPEAASQFKQSASLIVRLDVLEVEPAPEGVMPRVRVRATYEKSQATSETDAYDPDAAGLDDQYNKLQGRTMEFSIEPDGKLTNITGLDDILSNPSAAQAVRSWMSGLSSGAGFPRGGIAIGQKWGNDAPLTGTPLVGLVWHTDASYLRDEPCATATMKAAASIPSTAVTSGSSTGDMCAAILTRFAIVHRGSRKDATPPDYLKHGLRTSGTWSGSGESLDSISLASGMVIRSTQTSSQDMDFAISSTSSPSRLSYKGKVISHSEITLLLPAPPTPLQP